MRPAFAHLAMMQHENLIGIDDRAQSMRDRDRRSSRHENRQGPLNIRFYLAVHRAGRFVENEQRRVGNDRARERQELTLSDTDRRAALSKHL